VSTYDHITNEFSTDLSPLARRMYAFIFEETSDAVEVDIRVPADMICFALDVDTVSPDSPGQNALIELIKARLIGFDDTNCFRYYVMPAAWRAHLLYQRMLYELAVRGLEGTECALDAALKERA
jgi:hypothetical protein